MLSAKCQPFCPDLHVMKTFQMHLYYIKKPVVMAEHVTMEMTLS